MARQKPIYPIYCPHCGTGVRTDKGLAAHTSQRATCRAAAKGISATATELALEEAALNFNALYQFDNHDNPNDDLFDPPPESPIPLEELLTDESYETVTGLNVATRCDVNGQFIPASHQTLPPPIPNLAPPHPSVHLPAPAHPPEHYGSIKQFEWAEFIHNSELSSSQGDQLLKLLARDQAAPFTTMAAMHNLIDTDPVRAAEWHLSRITLPIDHNKEPFDFETESYELYHRSPEPLLRALLSNPARAGHQEFVPRRTYDETGARVYNEAYTAQKVWNAQRGVPEGAGVYHVLLSTDKTTMTQQTGAVSAYPLYLNCANNSIASRHLDWDIGCLLPTAKGSKEQKTTAVFASRLAHFNRRLFHACMSAYLKPLHDSATRGSVFEDASGSYRILFPRLFAHIADTPERTLIACTFADQCPVCHTTKEELGHPLWSVTGDHDGTHAYDGRDGALFAGAREVNFRVEAEAVKLRRTGEAAAKAEGYKLVNSYAHQFPGADVHHLLVPDLLHQRKWVHDYLIDYLYERIDHITPLQQRGAAKASIVRWIACIPQFADLKAFGRDGWSYSNGWSEECTVAMLKTIVPMTYVHAGHDTDAFKAVFSLCSFLFEAARRSTDESSLQRMENYLADFQASRHVFDPSVKSNWNSPRIHAFSHYGSSVREFGSLVGMSTAAAETAHIRSCKIPFRRTNKHRVEGQMSTITERTTTLAAHRANLESQGDLDSKKSRQEKAQELNGKIQGVVMKGPSKKLLSALAIQERDNLYGFAAAVSDYRHGQFREASRQGLRMLGQVLDQLRTYNSASVTYPHPTRPNAPLLWDRIISNPSWSIRNDVSQVTGSYARRDFAFVANPRAHDPADGFASKEAVRVLLFFSLTVYDKVRSFAWVEEMEKTHPTRHPRLKMWKVRWKMQSVDGVRRRKCSMIPIEKLQGALHLLTDKKGCDIPPGVTKYNCFDSPGMDQWWVNYWVGQGEAAYDTVF